MEELKKIVVEALDKNGSLDMIRSQLRSSVFGAIQSEQENPISPDLQKVLDSETTQFSICLLQEFLQEADAKHTQKIFLHETKVKADVKGKIKQKLSIQSFSGPGLYQVIRDFKEKFVPSEENKKFQERGARGENEEENGVKGGGIPEKGKKGEEDEEKSDQYSEDFEEIDEDIEIASEGTGKDSNRYRESYGSSAGIDPSVDSLALDQCDYLENAKKPKK